ncbi:MAG TPA: hypothetical protein VGP68_09925 [Gemmataceae bacterium]|jgi:uncharacterized repeat protein (TIGR01451 family)|nr:hypothetical protein [Gemmataceae bacterium]
MWLGRERILKLLLAAGLCLLSGCFGITQNPTYFPYLSFTGDIVQTHAKPVGYSYFGNFDPHAIKLEVRPLETTNPVRKQQILIATVYDEKGIPRRDRRVEWILEGVGNIVEVDESGCFPGRGYKVDNKYAVSYTSYREHRFNRGNNDPNDDYVIRPGQTWCVISSAVEGDSFVTAYAPEIHNNDNQRVFVTQRWVDAEWTIPQPAVNRAGAEHVFNTSIVRHTDKQPLANYRVRYTILDGPPAVFLPDRTQVTTVTSDLSGNAKATMMQVTPQAGQNRIGIEIIRPPDPMSPGGVGVIVGRGETTKQWQAASVNVTMVGPPTAVIGQEINYTVTITNTGNVEAQALTVRDPLPQGLQFVRGDPAPIREGNQLTWTLGLLPVGRSHIVHLTATADRPGKASNCVSVTSFEGLREERCVDTEVSAPQQVNPGPRTLPPTEPPVPGNPPNPGSPGNQGSQGNSGVLPPTGPGGRQPNVPQPVPGPNLLVSVNEPLSLGVGTPVTFTITLTNSGSAPATGILLSAGFDKGLEHDTKANPVELPMTSLNAGEVKNIPLILTPRTAGLLKVHITLTADGGIKKEVERTLTVARAQVALTVTGPRSKYVNQSVTWEIRVVNPTDIPLANVEVRDELPSEVTFVNATEAGQFVNGQVFWNVGNMGPKEQRVLQVTGTCQRASQALNALVNKASVKADGGLGEQAEAPLEILGLPAFSMDITKAGDPVARGGKVTYKIVVTNRGSLPANAVSLTVSVTPFLQITHGEGPKAPRTEPQRLIFPAQDGLQPGQSFTYTIEALGLQVGDARFRAELTTSTLPTPVAKEESTIIFDPANGAPKLAQPPAGPLAPPPTGPPVPIPPR